VYWLIFAAIVLSSIIGIAADRVLPGFLRNILHLAGSYWLAAMTYFLMVIVLVDLVRLLDGWTGFLPAGFKNNPAAYTTLGLVVILFVALLMVYGTWNARNIKVTSYEIDIPKQAGSL